MLRIHVLAAAVGALVLFAAAPSVQAKAGGKKHHALRGVVKSIDVDKDGGTITVKIGGKNKKGVETPEVERKIKVTSATTFVKVSHKKGEKGSAKTEPSSFDKLKDGDHVSIEVQGGKAVEVKFHGHHKKKAA
jgi:major membrane immunogen (membrane-anchored lipoprotein)